MQFLWGRDVHRNWAYFKWKYEKTLIPNPPLGIAARRKGEMVGVGGYFAIAFEVGENNDNPIILFPGDTCAHPDQRRKRLSVRLTEVPVWVVQAH